MFSICIPIYNQELSQLVYELHRQAVATGLAFEILLIDDASKQEYRAENRLIDLPHVRYIQLEKNIGRAKIRNLLVEESKYQYLIFMDGDMGVESGDYIRNYVTYMNDGIVCVGGRTYELQRPVPQKILHWKYGRTRETNSNIFMTCNFMIDKTHFDQIQFTMALDGYGHEDTLFGIQLKEAGIIIQHITNPLIHLDVKDAELFLNHTENALRNLAKINRLLQDQDGNYSQLLQTKNKLDKTGITVLARTLFPLVKPLLRRHLLSKHPSLLALDVYKFGFFVNL
ncbi:MAG: glycosyltransferase [Candidatus Symbiothrix sp.]|jgi:glycosyltransferase involved in cell wall biosynthesis|nr:glycosyltransferase [Candidatus Symbiothrix sp.]